ncbi:MAG: hypothetical protein DRJ05_18185, partial [Bacteroidetes bacterium]
QIYFDGISFTAIDKNSIKSFKKLIKPCVFQSKNHIVIEQSSNYEDTFVFNKYHNQQKSFLAIKKNDTISTPVYSVFDKNAYQLSQSYFNQIISKYNQITPPEANIIQNGSWDGDMLRLADSLIIFELVSWYLKVESQPVICSSFSYGNLFLIFDVTNDVLVKFNDKLQIQDTLLLFTKESPNQFNEFWQDKNNEDIYAVKQKLGIYYLRKINLRTGEANPFVIANELAFPSKTKIHGHTAYSLFYKNNTGKILTKNLK